VSAVNPLVAFYDIHGRKGEVLFFCSVPDTTRDELLHHHQPINVPTARPRAFFMDYTQGERPYPPRGSSAGW
jgi:hypothetical protein